MICGVVEIMGVLSRKCIEDSNAKGNDCGVSIPDAVDVGIECVISRC
jgi:hypothetical protein